MMRRAHELGESGVEHLATVDYLLQSNGVDTPKKHCYDWSVKMELTLQKK
ncbi:hypothetical protein LIT32_27330 (plasmid) [Bacillus sp. CMF21]|nr:hypothetical protein LIT32_27330 [Bacillus sp. CMF21]